MSHLRLRGWFLVLCFFSVMAGDAFADGKVFPAKAYRTSPTIHSQRAILTFKDGQETLVIESSFEGEGKEFGWVIPLPAKPTNFEEASKGFLETLSMTIQPNIIHDVSQSLLTLFGLTAIVGFYFIVTLFIDSKRRVFKLLLLLVFLFFGTFFLMPTLGHVEAGGNPSSNRRGVDVLDVQEVGSFGLVVLEADDSEALDGWLTENGFANLNDTERKIVSDYIKEGWCFVAAKLKRDGEGYSEPHPLAMTFEAEKPIYPMRLTAAADSDVFLELFVIADNYSSSPALTVEYASRYSYEVRYKYKELGYIGMSGGIGHPEKDKYMWDQCVMTRLCDVLGPEEMKEDIIVELNDGEDYQKRYYSYKGAFDSGLALGLAGWVCVIMALSILSNSKNATPLNWKGKIKNIFVPATCVLLVSWASVYVVVDKVDVSVDQKGGRFIAMLHEREVEMLVLERSAEGVFSDCTSIADVEKKLKNEVFPEIKKRMPSYTREMRLESSPGNVTVVKGDRGFVVRYYQKGGFYEDIVLADAIVSE